MNGSLFVGKTGLTAQDTALRVVANNLANITTDGFKKDRATFEDLIYQVQRQPGAQSAEGAELPSGLQLGTGVRSSGTQKMFTQGTLNITNQNLDIAIEGRGFFQIELPSGETGYTRSGRFQLNSEGSIVNSQGLVLDPQITVPSDATSLTIGTDGVVMVTQGADALVTQIGQIQLGDFTNPSGLLAVGGNMYQETVASGAPVTGNPGSDAFGSTVQGALENSNVNSVEELVNMISTQRAFEMNSKVISTADEMLSFITQQL